MGARVGLRVLGPVEAELDGELLELSPALRALAGALAVDAGRVVSSDALLDRLWEDEASSGSMATLQSYVSRLRRFLEPTQPTDGWQVLRTQAPGYRLVLPEPGLDAEQFRALLRHARSQSDPRTARDAVTRALALWRGQAYADLPQAFAAAEAARLHEQRLEARELAAELDLALGHHRDILDELAGLVRDEPLREGLRASYMLALYRSGQQAAALQVYDEGRHLLVESLGVDPGPELRRMHEQVLRQDPELEAPATSPTVVELEDEALQAPSSGIGRAAMVVPPTALIGREQELIELVGLVRDGVRLLTLTGTGGVGKTRLALALAHEVAPDFPDGAVLVPLATLQDPSLVLPTIARALRLPVTGGPDVAPEVAAQLAGRRLLLVLDNVEHLLDAAGDLAGLVGACPELVVVVTSRAPLRVSGEQERLVVPLALARDEMQVGLEEVLASPAVALFVERARSVAHRFSVDEHNAGAIAEICRRLGGIPLALELAATRLRLFGPDDLLLRLDEALASGPRDLPSRQRTMQATLDWSCRLLDEDAQKLFRRLSVFSGGWTLPMLQAVESGDVVPALETLVEHSLVSVSWRGPEPRYSMLEPTAQHARRLIAADEHAEAARAHAAAYVELAERAAAGYLVGEQLAWLEVVDYEHANLLAAFEWTLAHGDHDTAGRIVWALWLYWWLRSYAAVGRRAATTIAGSALLSPAVRVRAMMALAALSFAQGDLDAAQVTYTETLALAEDLDDLEPRANATAGLGIVALSTGDLDSAEALQREAIELGVELGSAGYGPWIVALGNCWLGTALLETGRRDEAVGRFECGLRLARTSGDRLAAFVALWNLSRAEFGRDDDLAHRHLVDGIALSQEVADLTNLSYFLDALVVVECRRGGSDDARLAELLGAAQGFRETAGLRAISYYLPDEAARDAAADDVRRRLGSASFDAAHATGRGLGVDDAVALALTAG